MSDRPDERLYNLLPAVYRQRDVERGDPLRALLAVMERELGLVEQDIAHLYDNWFIETCDPWVIPYIGDLLRAKFRHGGAEGASARAYVANTLAYRRRKGTAAVLEQLARDVTGWPAKVVECFQRLAASQPMDHVRLDRPATAALTDAPALARAHGPFETVAHAVDVRRIHLGRGRYNIPNVALFLWRIQAYPLAEVEARPAPDGPPGCFRLHPLGLEAPLFVGPKTDPGIDEPTGEQHVPDRISAIAFRKRPAEFAGSLHLESVPPEQLAGASLAWDKPGWKPPAAIAVDVDNGRVFFPDGAAPAALYAACNHGFSADLGGGPYPRLLFQPDDPLRAVDFAVRGRDPGRLQAALAAATASFEQPPEPGRERANAWVIRVDDSGLHRPPVGRTAWEVTVPADGTLVIEAAVGRRPTLLGDLRVVASPLARGTLILDGLWIDGSVTVTGAGDVALDLRHCTITGRARPAIRSEAHVGALTVALGRCLVGRVALPAEGPSLAATDCILTAALLGDPAAGAPAIAGPDDGALGPDTALERCTIFGAVRVRELSASAVLFTGRVDVDRRQTGCIRYCYVPPDSSTPRRFRCQPDLALAEPAVPPDEAEARRIADALQPRFTSVRFGHPAYAQLDAACPEALRTGAEDGAEIGVFHMLGQPQRVADLRASLDEHLRFGSEFGIFYVT